MLIPERQSRLKELLGRRGMAPLDTLAAELGVSPSTVRRDVEMLAQAGLVERTHGGVIWVGEKTASGARPYAFEQRMSYHVDIKRQIAAAAKSLVQSGQTVIIDGGTTTFYFAQELLGISLQLVTNSLPIANLFLNDENVELILTGGLMYPRYGVLLGPMTEEALAAIHTKTLFLSVAGIHDGQLYNQNSLLVQSELRMMSQAQEIVLLVDSGKFGQQALSRLGPLSEVDIVVTDAGITAEQREQVEKAGCQLIIAREANIE
ncbi:MAG TPA: DeoR/GlpR family DNA-binding transcription regulator [Tepidisphaeraceae bacterium]|jgi:DeoR/GlpR family transcriptional regulator of sugar metabolism|nr:DeoR/GlpR family DNA-binding transcription regulator [Tepidisphaeraceae bacterium]